MPNEETTTKFKVDISELKKEMQEAKRSAQLAHSEFKVAASECDNWQQSSNALSAKLKSLNSTLNEQKTKLALLEAEYNSLTDEQKQGSAVANRLLVSINKQKAAINNTEREIKNFEGSLEQVKKAEEEAAKTGKDVSEVLADMKKKTEGAEGGFTVLKGALANLVASGIKVAINGLKELGQAAIDAYQTYDEGADTVIAKTGATGEAAQELSANYKNVSKSIVGDFSDIGTAVGEVSTRFGVTGKDLENLSTKFLKFAELNGTDVNSSIDTVQKSLAAFGLETNEAGSVLDTLNKVGQDTGISMDTLSTMLVENASSFSQMGLDIHQAASFLGEIEKSGVTTSVAMTSLSKASQYAAEANKPLTTVLEETTQKMKNAKTDSEGLQIAYDVFGKKAGAKIYEACKTGSLSFDELSKAMADNSGSVDETYEATQDGMDKIKLAIQGAKTEVGDAIATFLDEHKEEIEALITDVKNGFQWLMDNAGLVAGGVATIGAAFATMKIVSFINDMKNMVNVVKGWELATKAQTIATNLQTAAQWLFNAAMNANPIMLIVTIIASVIAAIVSFVATNDDARAKFMEIWQGVCDFFKNIWNGIVSFFTGIWDGIKNVFSGVGSWFSEKFTAAKDAAVNAWNGAKEKWNSIKESVTGAFSNVGTWFKNKFEESKKNSEQAWANAKQAWSNIKDKVTSAFSNVGTWFKNKFEESKKNSEQAWANANQTWSNIKDKVISGFNDLGDKMKSKFSSALENAKQGFSKAKDIGKNIVDGIKNGIKNAWNNLKEWFSGLFDDLIGIAKKILGIKSPSRVFRDQIGKQIVAGLIEGINAEKGNAEKSAEELSQLYVGAAKDKVKELKEANEIAELDEIYFWENVQSYCAEGTEAYKTATDEIANAKRSLNDAVSSRTSDILGSMDLFEPVKIEGYIKGIDLIGNLQTQVAALQRYDDVLSALENRAGVKESGLYDELAKMGVDDLGTLISINALNDLQLENFIRLYSEKKRIAEDRAKREFGIIEDASTNELTEMANTLKAEAENVGASIIEGIKNGIASKIASLETELQILKGSLAGLIGADGITALSGSLGGLNASLVTAGGGGGNSIVNNYTQVINSPKTPNRLDLYRNTKNLLNYKGGK